MSQTPLQQHLSQKLQKEVPYSPPPSPAGYVRTVGFIGLGNIGGSIAQNLAVHFGKIPGSHGFVLWNRSRSKADAIVKNVEERLEKEGGIAAVKVADTVEDVVKESDIIFTVLASDAAVNEVYDKILKTLTDTERPSHAGVPRRLIIVDISTVYPSLTGELDSKISAIPNAYFIASPVFGSTSVAQAAGLIVCLAGDYKAKKEIAYLLVPAAGRKVMDLGGNVEKAVAFKLVGNTFIVGSLELLAETHTLADKIGVGHENFHHFITEMFGTPGLIKYSKRIMNDEFDGSNGFNMNGGLKDVHHIQRLATEYNCPVPIIDITQQHMISARALAASNFPSNQNKEAPLDWSAMVAASRAAAGLDPWDCKNANTNVVPEVED